MRRWAIIGVLLLILVLVGTAACSSGTEEGTNQQLAQVIRGDLTTSITGSGNIETSREASLSFGSGGKLDKVHVSEGDRVSKGDILAQLGTNTLDLALTQAEVALTQAKVALTQAQLSQQTAELELKNTRDSKATLELALLNAQIGLRTAEYSLESTIELYTWSDIRIAQANVDTAERSLEDAINKLGEYVIITDEGYTIPEEGLDDPEGFEVWQEAVVHAQVRLNTAKATLNALLAGFDIEEVAIKKLQIEAAQRAEAQAQKNLFELTDDIAIDELQLEIAKQSAAQAQQSVELAQESLDEAQRQLDESTIIAPFTGTIARVHAKEGDHVTPPTVAPQPVIYLIDATRLELLAEVDEIDIPGVRLDQEAVIEIDALSDAEFAGKVTAIYPVPILEGGVVLYNVKLSLDVPQNSGIKLGMSAEVDIITDKRSNVLLVPDRAIQEDSEGKPQVKVMVNEQIEERQVVTGISDGFQTEIVAGVNEGEVVIERQAKS